MPQRGAAGFYPELTTDDEVGACSGDDFDVGPFVRGNPLEFAAELVERRGLPWPQPEIFAGVRVEEAAHSDLYRRHSECEQCFEPGQRIGRGDPACVR